ncbi:MAG TPA: hypothetical protein VKS24_10480 [Bradyrhizobium sp.]|nr:hypothetical protein [Bradyrhizobium sp.]
MRVPREYAALALLFVVAAVPAWADGTLGLGEVLIAVVKAPKLVAEIQAELDRNGLKASAVTCIAARHGNHWKYLGGGRAAPYHCKIGKRTVSIEADRVYFDERGRLMGDLGKADPKRAKTFKEGNFRWTWTP